MVSGPARSRLIKAGGWVAALVPLALLVADALRHRLGANPIEAVLNRLGFWTLTFLALSLLPTPLRSWTGLAWPLRLRRLLGVTAFSYAALHFAWYLGVDQFFDLQAIGADIVKRPFITVGFATLLLLLPLAITSTDGWVRRLGFARWKALHRLAYAAALLGVVHFAWRVKADRLKPALFALAIGLLLLARLRPAPPKR
jgi:sulfoxide reductase heme-binding subunit YedZ